MYSFENENGLRILYCGKPILCDIELYAKINGKKERAVLGEIRQTGERCAAEFTYGNKAYATVVTFRQYAEGIIVNISASFEKTYLAPALPFIDATAGLVLRFSTDVSGGVAARYMKTVWWSHTSFAAVPEKTQDLLINRGSEHLCLTALCGENHRARLRERGGKTELCLDSECMGLTAAEGDFLAIACGCTPQKSLKKRAALMRKAHGFLTPKKEEKHLPQFAQGLGWCTWNAFYHDVSAEKIEKKLREFKEKGVKISRIIIDDGWTQANGWKLCAFEADPKKFPNGLAAFIKRIKAKYGITHVGIWHSMMAYWWGVDEGSPLAEKYRDCLMKTEAGILMPDFRTEGKALSFFLDWHRYLRECGVDFLKIDTQGEIGVFMRGSCPVTRAFKNAHRVMEESVHRIFNDELINCMGMGNESFGAREHTALVRSSDDFCPSAENGFAKHVVQNVYNSLFYDDFYMCDFDMWQTDNAAASRDAVLRAISGGPVYVSDEMGKTVAERLVPLADECGSVHLCDTAALPVPAQVYGPHDVFKVMNTAAGCNVTAAFNLKSDVRCTRITHEDLKNDNTAEYVAYMYFAKKFVRFKRDTVLEFEVDGNGCEIICFYPVKGEYIMLGDTAKYISPLYNPVKTNIRDLPIDE